MLGSHNTRHLPNGIHIKSASTTLAESSLHGGLVGGVRSGVVEPIGVQGSGSVRENEGISRRGVRCIQDSDLRSDLRVSVVMDMSFDTRSESTLRTHGTTPVASVVPDAMTWK